MVALLAEGATPVRALTERAAALRARGVHLPVQGLAAALRERLVSAVERLPDAVEEALDVLDLAEAAGTVLDLSDVQLAAARWWLSGDRTDPGEALDRLRDRLGLSPEIGATT